MSENRDATEIGYAEFGEWYDAFRERMLEPALVAADASLQRVLTDSLSERDLARIRSTTGRVKSKRRTWRKIRRLSLEGQTMTLKNLSNAVDDLVGLRITCINLRDIDMVQAALEGLPNTSGSGLWLEPESERDYVSVPKESGYRGWHVRLGIEIDGSPVVCELQVRTLLQDSWGELTHEEIYSNDGSLPPLVDVLSTRMSDLLSVLDGIAEDLRSELDRIDQEAVGEHDPSSEVVAETLAGQAADAAALLRGRWSSITRPTDLAGLAWSLQKEFGAEISDGWFGHGSFKRFLRHAVPDGEISAGRRAYLLPAQRDLPTQSDEEEQPHDQPANATAADGLDRDTIPGPARRLRQIDREFPLLANADWPVLFEHLSESWRRIKPTDSRPATVNRLTRSARDLARDAGMSLSRRSLDYVAKTLLVSNESATGEAKPPSASALASQFAELTTQRMIELRILERSASKDAKPIADWINGVS